MPVFFSIYFPFQFWKRSSCHTSSRVCYIVLWFRVLNLKFLFIFPGNLKRNFIWTPPINSATRIDSRLWNCLTQIVEYPKLPTWPPNDFCPKSKSDKARHSDWCQIGTNSKSNRTTTVDWTAPRLWKARIWDSCAFKISWFGTISFIQRFMGTEN